MHMHCKSNEATLDIMRYCLCQYPKLSQIVYPNKMLAYIRLVRNWQLGLIFKRTHSSCCCRGGLVASIHSGHEMWLLLVWVIECVCICSAYQMTQHSTMCKSTTCKNAREQPMFCCGQYSTRENPLRKTKDWILFQAKMNYGGRGNPDQYCECRFPNNIVQ